MNQYSFTGKGNILIKAGAAGKYGSKQYLANEPIAYFTDVTVDLSFSNLDKIAKQGINNLVADSKSEASILRVQNITTSESLQSLLYKKQINNTKDKTEVKNLTSVSGELYLPIQNDEVVNSEIFIYDNLKNIITTYTYNNGVVSGLNDGVYTIFYSINKIANSTFALDTPMIPNIALEIVVNGNLNGTTGLAVLHLNKVKLLSRPTLNFNSSTPFVDTLEFAILNDKESIEINYYG